jgi:hypothetical protein
VPLGLGPLQLLSRGPARQTSPPHQQPGRARDGVQHGGQGDVEPVALPEPVQAEVVEDLPYGECHHAQQGGEGAASRRHGEQGQGDACGSQDRHRPRGQRPGAQRAGGGDHDEPSTGFVRRTRSAAVTSPATRAATRRAGPAGTVPRTRSAPGHTAAWAAVSRSGISRSSVRFMADAKLGPPGDGRRPAGGGARPLTRVAGSAPTVGHGNHHEARGPRQALGPGLDHVGKRASNVSRTVTSDFCCRTVPPRGEPGPPSPRRTGRRTPHPGGRGRTVLRDRAAAARQSLPGPLPSIAHRPSDPRRAAGADGAHTCPVSHEEARCSAPRPVRRFPNTPPHFAGPVR